MSLMMPSTAGAALAPGGERPLGAPLRASRRLAPAAALAVFAVPFAAYSSLVLYQFYVTGSFLLDAGWFAYVVSARDLSLPNPLSLGGESFFATHISPIFWVTALFRRALAISDAQFFALFIGLCHALPGLGVFWLLRSAFGVRTAIAAGAGIAFAFNGLALAIARYPHFEILIVGAAILFAAALVRRRLAIATLCFAVALATREDAGFHLFALLFVLVALNRRCGVAWREQRAEIAFAAVALLYSGIAIAAQSAIASGPSALMRIYVGDPPFADVTLVVVASRLLGYLALRPYLVLPALVALLWAVRAHNPGILVGYVAFVPWALLHLIAHSPVAATLSGYYAYPFMIAAFWPLVGVLYEWRRAGGTLDVRLPLFGFCAMIAVSFAGLAEQPDPSELNLAQAFLAPPSPGRQAATEHAVAQLVRSKAALGAVLVDGSVVALAPDGFVWTETVRGRAAARPDTVAYFADGYESATARQIAAVAGLSHHYRAPGTALRLASARPIVAPAPIAALLVGDDAPE